MMSLEKIGRHAAELMILAIEIGLVDRERVDEMLDLVVGVGAQHGEIGLERGRSGGGNPLGEAAVDVIALVVVERHAGAAIKKFAEAPDILLRDMDGTRSVGSGRAIPA